MGQPAASPAIAALRERVARLEGGPARNRATLPFGVPRIDKVLPGGGLALGALHDVAGGRNGAIDGAAAALFAAGIAARAKGKVLWCVPGRISSPLPSPRLGCCRAVSSMSRRATKLPCSPASKKGFAMAV